MKHMLLVAVLTLVGLPMLAYGATYSYVATSGDTRTIEAQTAEDAIATAPDRAPRSGVVIAQNVGGDIDGNGTVRYQYVSTTGNVFSVEAMSATEALATANNRAEHSGVIMAETNPIPETITVPL